MSITILALFSLLLLPAIAQTRVSPAQIRTSHAQTAVDAAQTQGTGGTRIAAGQVGAIVVATGAAACVFTFQTLGDQSSRATARVPGPLDPACPDGTVPGPWYFWFDWGPFTTVLVNSVERADWQYFGSPGNMIVFAAGAIAAGDVVEVVR
jgi:hypothetical protein